MLSESHLRLEVPIFGPEAGVLAASLGVGRLELNHAGSYALGGTTPTLSELSALLSSLKHECGAERPAIRVMIRPRGPPPPFPGTAPPSEKGDEARRDLVPQDFLYTPAELAAMAASMSEFAASGLLDPGRGDGFVFGVLRRRGAGLAGAPDPSLGLDVQENGRLTALARSSGFKCVLHRAVDDLFSHAAAAAGGGAAGREEGIVREVKACGFDGVLTSGGEGRAVDNIRRLRAVVDLARKESVEVVVGGGVRSGNLRRLVEGLGQELGSEVWFHSSCLGAEERFDDDEAMRLAEALRACVGLRRPTAKG